jgi:hypothetical protein
MRVVSRLGLPIEVAPVSLCGVPLCTPVPSVVGYASAAARCAFRRRLDSTK